MSTENEYKCNFCDEVFEDYDTLKIHKNISEKCLKIQSDIIYKYSCCDSYFTNMSDIEEHIKNCKNRKDEASQKTKDDIINELNELTEQNKKLTKENKKLEQQLEKYKSKDYNEQISKYLEPLTEEVTIKILQLVNEKSDIERIRNSQEGLANNIKHFIKKYYITDDQKGQYFYYKSPDNSIHVDTQAIKLINLFKNSITTLAKNTKEYIHIPDEEDEEEQDRLEKIKIGRHQLKTVFDNSKIFRKILTEHIYIPKSVIKSSSLSINNSDTF